MNREIKFLLSVVFVLVLGINVNASTITSKAVSGSWATATNWVGNITPTDSDNVVIASGANITMVAGTICAGLTINSGGTFTTVAGTLTVNGNVSGAGTISSSANTHIISLTGNWSFNGTSNIASGGPRVNFTGTANQALSGKINTDATGGYLYINKTSGTVTLGAAMNTATFNVGAGTFDASTFKLTCSTRTLSAGRVRIGANGYGYTDNFSGPILQSPGSTIEYYNTSTSTSKYMMQGNHGGNVEITGGNGTWLWSYPYNISGNLTLTESTNNINFNYLPSVGGNFTVNTTGSVATTIACGDGAATAVDIGGNFTLSGTSNVTFFNLTAYPSNLNIAGALTVNSNTKLKTSTFSSLTVTGDAYIAPSGTLTLYTENSTPNYSLPNLVVDGTLELMGGGGIFPYPMTINGKVIMTDGVNGTTGNFTFQSAITISTTGSFTMGGTYGGSPNTFSDLINNGTFTEPNGTSGVGPITFTGNLINNGTYTANPNPDGNAGTIFTGPNAVIDGTNPVTIPRLIVNSPGVLTALTDVIISKSLSGTGTFIGGSTSVVEIDGTNTVNIFISGGRTVVTTGDLKAGTYQDLEVKTNGSGVSLLGAVTLNGDLDLTKGKLILGNYDLTVKGNIIGGSDSAFVVTNGTGRLFQNIGDAAVLFPVGSIKSPDTTYNPVIIKNLGTADMYGVGAKVPGIDGYLSATTSTRLVNRFWKIKEAVAGGSKLVITPQWKSIANNTGYGAAITPKFGYYNGAAWTTSPTIVTGTSPYCTTDTFNLVLKNMTTEVTFGIGKDDAFTNLTTKTIVTDPGSLAFGLQCVNSPSGLNTGYTLSGYNLTDSIKVTAPTGFKISVNPASGFDSVVKVASIAGYVKVTPVYVQFLPTTLTAYSGNTGNTSAGATTKNIALTGTGQNRPASVLTPTAVLSGNYLILTSSIIYTGCKEDTARGFEWSYATPFTVGAPANAIKRKVQFGVFSIGMFTDSIDLSKLSTSTTIYIKAFASNAVATSDTVALTYITPSAFRYATTGNWNASPSIWSDSKSGVTGFAIPDANASVFIPNGVTVTIPTGYTANGKIVVEAGGKVIVQGTGQFNGAATTLRVSGTIERLWTGFGSPTLTMLAGSKYLHNIDGYQYPIPTATWDATSTCEIKGFVNGTRVEGMNQTFGNVIWNCASQIGTLVPFGYPGIISN
jgi:hypothetical protein